MATSIRQTVGSAIALLLQSILDALVFVICRLNFNSVQSVIPSIKNDLLLEPAVILATKIRNKQVTSEEVVRAYIDRIRRVQPIINAVTDQRFEEALKEAREVDDAIRNSTKTSDQLASEQPFLGVPFSSKNTIGIKDLSQDAGLVAKRGDTALEDAEVIGLLRKAGAIPLVTTNVPELSMSWDTSNQVHGRTKNPYDLRRSPGGSSGGEAALITAGGSVMGVGNDIGGSIRIPSLFCGIFGHKPTSNLVSNRKQYPSSEGLTLDLYRSTGPMCRYACDLLPLLKVMADKNSAKLTVDKADLKNVCVYYTNDYLTHPQVSSVNMETQAAIKKAVAYLKEKFHVKTEAVSIPEMKEAVEIAFPLLFGPRADEWTRMMRAGKGDLYVTLEFVKWFFGCSDHTLFCLLIALLLRVKNLKNPELIERNKSVLSRLRARFNQFLDGNSVFLYPTSPLLAPYPYEVFTGVKNLTYTTAFNFLEFPVTQCPLGLNSSGLPLGVQIVGNMGGDALTIAVAEELERGFGGWSHP